MPDDVPEAPEPLVVTLSGYRATLAGRPPAPGLLRELRELGVDAATDPDGTVTLPARHLPLVAARRDRFELCGTGPAAGIVETLRRPPLAGTMIELVHDGAAEFTLRWTDGRAELSEPLDAQLLPSFLAVEIPFAASDAAWDAVSRLTRVPPALGRAHLDEDHVLRIRTSNPQRLEHADLPGLFRISDHEFGLSAAYADTLSRVTGIAWDGDTRLDPLPASAYSPGFDVSDAFARTLRTVTHRLHLCRAQVLAWPDAQQARVITVAALDRLAVPSLLVLAPAASLWLWQLLLERSGFDEDTHLHPLEDLDRLQIDTQPAALLLELSDPAELTTFVAPLTATLHALPATGRVAALGVLAAAQPPDTDTLLSLLALLRPAEFASDLPLPLRYPTDPPRRAAEHVAPFVLPSPPADLGLSDPVSCSTLARVEPSAGFLDALASQLRRAGSPDEEFVVLRRAFACGAGAQPSPKLVRAAAVARTSAVAGRSVAVLCREPAAPDVLALLLHGCETLSGFDVLAPVPGAVQLWFGRDGYPDLEDFDDVVVLEYPERVEDLHYAASCARLVVVHAAHPFDETAALLLARTGHATDEQILTTMTGAS